MRGWLAECVAAVPGCGSRRREAVVPRRGWPMFARMGLVLALASALLVPTWLVGPVASAAQTPAGPSAAETGLIPPPTNRYALPPSTIGAGFHEVDHQERP